MQNIEPIPFAHHLLAPPMKFPFGLRRGQSMFASQRNGGDFYRCHAGIDLFPKGSPPHDGSVYATNAGTVEIAHDTNAHQVGTTNYKPDWSIWIRHHPHSSGVYTNYRHLVTVEPNIQPNYHVGAGELLGHIIDGSVSWSHLHFQWFRLTDPADPAHFVTPQANPPGGNFSVHNYIPLDPTPLLYRFEAYLWPNRGSGEVLRHEHQNIGYEHINRIRVLPWQGESPSQPGVWLLQVAMPDPNNPTSDEFFFLPVNDALPHEKLLTDVIRDAFHNRNRVRLVWRDSYFYDERRMIDDVRVRP